MPSSKSSLDKRDVYYRKGKSDGYRARSAYKLLHLDEEFDLFRAVTTAVDLCAAPGSWSQVLGQRLKPSSTPNRVVSIDLQPMAPLPGITCLQADITTPGTVPRVLDALGGRKADLVVCDGAPDVTGVHDLDAYLHSQLLLAALTLSLTLMAPGATLIFKIFLSPLDPKAAVLRSQLRAFFPGPLSGDVDAGPDADAFAEFDAYDHEAHDDAAKDHSGQPAATRQPGFDTVGRRGGVWVRKPRSSRKGSGEAFVVCRNFDPSTLPLPTEFTEASLAALRTQVTQTLTLESLAHLGSDDVVPGASWPATKGFVGGGDLNGINHAVNGVSINHLNHRPLLSVEVSNNRNRSTSIRSIDERPSPVPTHASLFPENLDSLTPSTERGPSAPTLLTAVPDTPALFYAPDPLPSPAPGSASENRVRDFKTLTPSQSFSTSPTWGSPLSTFPSSKPSPTYLSAANLSSFSIAREREIAASTPQADGAVSPALSTASSKTDAFFATSQRDSLPVPPRAINFTGAAGSGTTSDHRSTLGRTPSIGRGIPPVARSRVVTTPAGSTSELQPMFPQLSTSPTSPTHLPAPTPLRAVTGPMATPEPTPPLSPSPPPPPQPVPPLRSDAIAASFSSAIAREAYHAAPSDTVVHVNDVLVPLQGDDNALPIRSPSSTTSWRLIRALGQGAFAQVWSAEPAHNTTKHDDAGVVAVKLVDRAACKRNPRNAIAFYREVEVLRHLVHPGIVGYVAHFSTAAHHCLVLERLGGGELFSLIEDDANRSRMLRACPGENGDPQGEGLVRRIFGELARAVAWLHEVEVVHRDIKLENILFTVNPFTLPPTAAGSVPLNLLPAPLVKLTDFGLSRFIRADNPLLTTRCGSEAYAAPEVVMGNLYDGRKTDAWALGVVLYALVAGELPFEDGAPPPPGRARAGSSASTVSAAASDSPRDVRRRTMLRIAKGEYGWREGVGSPGVRAVVARLLTRDPSRRARVASLWEEEWVREGPGAVLPPSQPMVPRAGGVGKATAVVASVEGVPVAVSGRRASDTPHVVVDNGVLVDHERIDDVARLDVAAE